VRVVQSVFYEEAPTKLKPLRLGGGYPNEVWQARRKML